jgi:cobalamin biosynthesis protein CobC
VPGRAIERRGVADQRLEHERGERQRWRWRKGHDGLARISARFLALAYHGGALDVARRLAPHAPKPWIDLSTGINPHAYPLAELPPGVWTRLPSADELAGLEAAAGRRYGASPEAVVAGPGSQALIQTLARLRPAASVAILGPTYGGHAEAFAASGGDVMEAASPEALAGHDVAVVVNPNNPDGRLTQRADLLDLAAGLRHRRGLLLVDEAFADFDGVDQSLAGALPETCVVVLRSFGKTFGLAGLRLGFAIASADVAQPLRAALGPWRVSGPAIAIGTQALADITWTEAMAARLGWEAARLDALLTGAGWRILGGARLFRLAARPDATQGFERLLQHGILTRPFAHAPDRLRFGLPGTEEEWARVEAALRG